MRTTARHFPSTEKIHRSRYSDMIRYLEQASRSGAKFYIQKPTSKKLRAIRFDPSILQSSTGTALAKYLLDAENAGEKIYVKKPDEKIKRVSFLIDLASSETKIR